MWKRLFLILISFVVLFDKTRSIAQDNLSEPIVSFAQIGAIQFPGNFIWSADSETLYFADVITLPTNEWYAYDLNEKNIKPVDELELHPELENLELADAILGDEKLAVPISLSPDKNYAIFNMADGDEVVTSYGSFPAVEPGIVSVQQKSMFIIPQMKLPGVDTVLWSDDGSAFVLTKTIVPYDWVNVQYVSNYTTKVSSAVVRDLRGGLWIGNTVYAVNGAYDLSANGERALMRVNVPSGSRTYKLYIYNAHYPDHDQFIDDFDADSVIAGSFAPGDESKLWLFNDIGIIQYDLVTEEITVLNTSINSRLATAVTINDPALFSPDGHYLATLGDNGLYLLDLTEHIPQSSPNTAEVTTQPLSLERLWITVDCPTQVSDKITWRIFNPNPESVTVMWQRRGFDDEDTLDVPEGSRNILGQTTFETDAAPPNNTNTVDIFVDGVFHDTRSCTIRTPNS